MNLTDTSASVKQSFVNFYHGVKDEFIPNTYNKIKNFGHRTVVNTERLALQNPLSTLVVVNATVAAVAHSIFGGVFSKLFGADTKTEKTLVAAASTGEEVTEVNTKENATKSASKFVVSVLATAGVLAGVNYFLLNALGITIISLPVLAAMAGGALVGIAFIELLKKFKKAADEVKVEVKDKIEEAQQDIDAAKTEAENARFDRLVHTVNQFNNLSLSQQAAVLRNPAFDNKLLDTVEATINEVLKQEAIKTAEIQVANAEKAVEDQIKFLAVVQNKASNQADLTAAQQKVLELKNTLAAEVKIRDEQRALAENAENQIAALEAEYNTAKTDLEEDVLAEDASDKAKRLHANLETGAKNALNALNAARESHNEARLAADKTAQVVLSMENGLAAAEQSVKEYENAPQAVLDAQAALAAAQKHLEEKKAALVALNAPVVAEVAPAAV